MYIQFASRYIGTLIGYFLVQGKDNVHSSLVHRNNLWLLWDKFVEFVDKSAKDKTSAPIGA